VGWLLEKRFSSCCKSDLAMVKLSHAKHGSRSNP